MEMARGNWVRVDCESWIDIRDKDGGEPFTIFRDDAHIESGNEVVGPDFDAALAWAREIAAEEQAKLANRVRPFSEMPPEGKPVSLAESPAGWGAIVIGGKWYHLCPIDLKQYAGWRPRKEGT